MERRHLRLQDARQNSKRIDTTTKYRRIEVERALQVVLPEQLLAAG